MILIDDMSHFASREIMYHMFTRHIHFIFMELNCDLMIRTEIEHFIMFQLDIIQQ